MFFFTGGNQSWHTGVSSVYCQRVRGVNKWTWSPTSHLQACQRLASIRGETDLIQTLYIVPSFTIEAIRAVFVKEVRRVIGNTASNTLVKLGTHHVPLSCKTLSSWCIDLLDSSGCVIRDYIQWARTCTNQDRAYATACPWLVDLV